MLLVDRQSTPMKFVQIWTSIKTRELVKREGTVGKVASVVELPVGASDPSQEYLDQGYELFPPGGWAQLVIQWPMNSVGGNARDNSLLARAGQWLEVHLDERGLGRLDGHDRGRRMSPDGGFVLNMYSTVVDGSLAATAAMTCMRNARLDPTRASVAYRHNVNDPWIVRYDRVSNKIPGDFAL